MRIVATSELEHGDVLARAVHSVTGLVMLEAGTILTEKYINRLKTLNIKSVHLKVPEAGFRADRNTGAGGSRPGRPVEPSLVLPDINRMKNNDKARMEAVKQATDFTGSLLMQDRLVLPLQEDAFRRKLRDTMLEITSQREFAEELGVMMQTDQLLFEQALNVLLCSNVIGTAQNYDPVKLYELSLGSLFCDIGMTRLPMEITKVNRPLTEAEMKLVRQHTTEGYRVLKGMKNVPISAAQVALLHHERYRGEGYPLGVKKDAIPEFAQIAGLADVYNALVSPRHHRKSHDPGEATEYLFASGNYDFDLSIIQVFLRHLTLYPVSSLVRLSTGQVAMVTVTAGRPINRPIVQIYTEADGTVVKVPYTLDLAQENNIVIFGKAEN